MGKRKDIKKILVIGAGPIVIGQACEFDYSGTQACKALKDEGYKVILINSNPATIMTDPEVADKTYIEPITTEIIEIQYKRNKNRIINEIKNLIEGLSQSIHIVSFSKELGEFINKNINILKNDESVKKYDEEPYRLSLSIILKKKDLV